MPDTPMQRSVTFVDTAMVASIWNCSREEKLFPDPDTFTPERFLDEDGKFQAPDSKAFLPFGAGK